MTYSREESPAHGALPTPVSLFLLLEIPDVKRDGGGFALTCFPPFFFPFFLSLRIFHFIVGLLSPFCF